MFLTLNKKSPYYQLTYSIEGKRTTVSTKTKDLNEAKKFLASFSIPYKVNNVVFELNNSIFLSKFQDECINYLSQSKAKSYIERSIKPAFKFLLAFTGDVLLTDLTVRVLDSFINERFKISQSSATLYYRTLKAIFTKAVNWGYLQENPLKKIRLPKVIKSFPVFISLTDFTNIINNTKNPVMQNIFTLAFYTGMRLGEILNMKWNWININQNLITVKCTEDFTTKSKKERVIPISKNLKPILLEQFPKLIDINQNDFVFTYLINLASPDRQLWKKSVDALVVELMRAEQLGIPHVVVHPGAYTTSSEAAGLARIVRALDELHRQTRGLAAGCLLETTAGQGTNLGWRFEHLAEILARVRDPDRLGVCFDTCHVFAAGYPMAQEKQYKATMRQFNATVGVRQIRAFHLNDSKTPLGSRVDRHAKIGAGRMGRRPFKWLLADRRFRRIPMYMETPKGTEEGEELDVINLRTLRTLIPRKPRAPR